jgi:hypothetical protein
MRAGLVGTEIYPLSRRVDAKKVVGTAFPLAIRISDSTCVLPSIAQVLLMLTSIAQGLSASGAPLDLPSRLVTKLRSLQSHRSS